MDKRKDVKRIILWCAYCLLFYISCYFMVPSGSKVLFFFAFCIGGFALPWIPYLIKSRIKSKAVLSIIKVFFMIPAILFVVYLFRLYNLANNNYVIHNSTGIKYSVKTEWELLENNYVGEDFDHFIYSESKEERITKAKYYYAEYGQFIDLSLRVRENDEYDESEFKTESVEIPVTVDFGKQRSIKKVITLDANTELTSEGMELIENGDNRYYPEDKGSAQWECTVTINRVLDFWDVLFAK